MAKARKKPVVIEYEQYTQYGKLVKGMCNSVSCYQKGNNQPHVHTIHNDQIVNLQVGDYVVPEPDGIHFYPIKSEIFEKTYDLISSEVFNGSFEFINGELHFICTTKDMSFQTVKEGLLKLKTEIERQLENQTNCPFYE